MSASTPLIKGQKLFCSQTKQNITLVEQIATSGEGEVWITSRSDYLAKIYHEPTIEREKKLKIMINNPPKNLQLTRNPSSLAWPYSVLYDSSRQRQFMGFLMPYIKDTKPLHEVYHPKLRKKLPFPVHWKFLHQTALHFVRIVKTVHAQGYIIGDMKPQNILVNRDALPTIIDTDSFQVIDSQQRQIYHCGVLSEGFNPPEILKQLRKGKEIKNIQQYQTHDNFRLAVIIYHLLFGQHPFKGKWTGLRAEPNKIDDLVENGYWPYAKNSPIRPGKTTIPFDSNPLPFYPQLKVYFLQCFNEGHSNPKKRPQPEDWETALEQALNNLVKCDNFQDHRASEPFKIRIQHETHYYDQGYQKCYWCERAKNLGQDIFTFVPIYNRLEKQLNSQQWKNANLETAWLVMQVMGGRCLLNQNDIKNIQGFDSLLKNLDQLWLKHSSGNFGFTEQKGIYERLVKANANKTELEIFQLFTQAVGWDKGSSNVNWNRKGHFPYVTSLVLDSCQYIDLLKSIL